MSNTILQASLHSAQHDFTANGFLSISAVDRKSTLLDGRISNAWQRQTLENGDCTYGSPGVLRVRLLFSRDLIATWFDRRYREGRESCDTLLLLLLGVGGVSDRSDK